MRRMTQSAAKETDGRTWPGRVERRATRRRSNRSAGHPHLETALRIRATQRAPGWRQNKMEMESGNAQDNWVLRQYAGNGSYSNMQLTAVRELSSCAPKSQLRHRCHKLQRMITDAAIFEATTEVEKAEQELKGLSEALDNMKVRS